MMQVEERTLILLVRNKFVRINARYGLKPATPYRTWLARVLLDALKEIYPRPTQLVGWAIFNYGHQNSGIAFDEAPEWLKPHLLNARGTSGRYARDFGGWNWQLVRDIYSAYAIVVQRGQHYTAHLRFDGLPDGLDEIYTALLACARCPSEVQDTLNSSWWELLLQLLDKFLQQAESELQEAEVQAASTDQ